MPFLDLRGMIRALCYRIGKDQPSSVGTASLLHSSTISVKDGCKERSPGSIRS